MTAWPPKEAEGEEDDERDNEEVTAKPRSHEASTDALAANNSTLPLNDDK